MVPAMEANIARSVPWQTVEGMTEWVEVPRTDLLEPSLSVYLLPSNYLAAFSDWFAHL